MDQPWSFKCLSEIWSGAKTAICRWLERISFLLIRYNFVLWCFPKFQASYAQQAFNSQASLNSLPSYNSQPSYSAKPSYSSQSMQRTPLAVVPPPPPIPQGFLTAPPLPSPPPSVSAYQQSKQTPHVLPIATVGSYDSSGSGKKDFLAPVSLSGVSPY